MKKLLSIVLALSLCLTAMMGCFVVSAEDTAAATITIVGNTVAPGENATITVTGANFTTVCAADLEITLAEGLTFVSMSKDGTALSADDTENAPDYVVNGQVVKYLDIFNGFEGYETTILNLEITAKVAEDAADGATYAVTGEILAADYNENTLDVAITAGAVTVEVPCDHAEFTYTNNGDGTHIKACSANCGEYEAVTEDCVYDEETNTCVCGAVEVTEPECEHNWVVTEATAAIGDKDTNTTTTAGTLTETCSLCGETNANQTVTYNDTYRASYVNLDLDAEISFQYHVKDSVLENAENVSFKTTLALDGLDVIDYTTMEEADDTMRGTNKDVACQTIKTGIAAKYMTDYLTLNTFVKIDGVWYSGREQSYNVVNVAKMNVGSTNTEELTLYANLLNYGGEAQKYFKYRTDNYANSADNLGDFAPYVTEELPEVEADMVNSYTLPTVRFSNFKYALESKISLKLAYRLDTAETVPDVANLKTVVNYTYLGLDNTVTYDTFELYDSSTYDDRYCFYLDAFSAKQMRVPFTVTIYDGETQCNCSFTGTIAGIAKYLIDSGSAASDGTEDLFYSMIKYGDAAAAYFS